MESIISILTPKKMTYYMDVHSTIRQALEKFDAHKFSVVPLINEEGKFAGTLSEGDILRYIKNEAHFDLSVAERVKISEIEHYRPYQSLRIDASLKELFDLSLMQNFVPLVDDKNVFIGIIKRKDVIALLSKYINLEQFDK